MSLAFVLLSLLLYVITIQVWQKPAYSSELKINLILVMLGFVAFNFLMSLLLLFDILETNPDNVIQQFAKDGWTLMTLGFCLINVLFYSVFTILFLIRSVHQKQNA
jgi:hypothetical protein